MYQRFDFRIYLVLIALGGVGLVFGGQALTTALQNPKPHELRFNQWISERPTKKWLRLQGCVLNVLDAAEQTEKGEFKWLFVPVYSVEHWDEHGWSGEIPMLLRTTDPAMLATYRELKSFKDMSEEQRRAHVATNQDKLFLRTDIEGLIKFGVEGQDDKDREKLRSLTEDLASDFELLAHNERPSMSYAIAMLIMGVLCVGFLLINLTGFGKPIPVPTIEDLASRNEGETA